MAKKQKKINRYNAFQTELSRYVKETGGVKGDFKRFKGVYKQLGADVTIKRFGDAIPVLIKKLTQAEPTPEEVKYDASFPFYSAKAIFSFPKYSDKVIGVKFDDGGFQLDWTGTAFEFMTWFSGDIMGYFRNNYNDSPTAEFVLKNVDGKKLYYVIEVQGSLYGTERYVPPDKGLVIKDKAYKTAQVTEAVSLYTERKAKLIEQMRSVGYSNEEIKDEIKQLDKAFYGKK